MPFNLIHDKWIPVRRKSGEHCLIEPWKITDKLASDPFIALDAPRPDFNGALIQFLIGLVQTTMAPPDEFEWRKLLNEPPSPESLKDAFSKYQDAFNLDGEGKRFMQETELDDGEEKMIHQLLIDYPGDSPIDENRDHFIKRIVNQRYCSSCCATAIYTHQILAISGGRGHLASIRKLGPLTTIVNSNQDLWRTISLNIWSNEIANRLLLSGNHSKHQATDIFPWTSPLSHFYADDGPKIFSSRMHPTFMFWATPRRILMDFNDVSTGSCDLCATDSSRLIRRYWRKPNGAKFEGVWKYQLSPFEQNSDEIKCVKTESGCTSYRHWLGLVQQMRTKSRISHPAPMVFAFLNSDRCEETSAYSLTGFGHQVDGDRSGVANGWYEGTMPLFSIPESIKGDFEFSVEGMIMSAIKIADNTKDATKQALFGRIKGMKKSGFAEWKINTQVKGSTTWVQSIGDAFWQNTESDFYESLRQLRTALSDEEKRIDLMKSWHRILKVESERLFDLFVEGNNIEDKDPRCIVLARKELRANNNHKDILGALQIPKTI